MIITIELQVHFEEPDGKVAYDKLCDALAAIRPEVEWESICYRIDDGPNRPTDELWPEDGSQREIRL